MGQFAQFPLYGGAPSRRRMLFSSATYATARLYRGLHARAGPALSPSPSTCIAWSSDPCRSEATNWCL
jgi:hypothetical protein